MPKLIPSMTVSFTTISLYFISALLFLCSKAHVSHLSTSLESSTTSGLSLNLIHREFSPLSPFYNPLATHFERLENVIRRSNSRFQSRCRNQSKSPCLIESNIRQIDGNYLMKLLFGTPPVETLGVADTGSDLTWIQCKPCKRCFEHVNPLFNQRASSSYKTLECTSKQCKAFEGSTGKCTRKHNKCQYNATYADRSYSHGHLATETLTFGKSSIEKYVFGCGHSNRGLFSSGSSGVIGLGGGPLSIISQLEETIKGKFSYCLVPFDKNETSTIHFGEKAQVLSSKAVSTPFFQTPDKTFYYLHLEKVIIGNKSIEFPRRETEGRVQSGNILLDSGTTMTKLPRGEFYDSIVSTLKEVMGVESINQRDWTSHFCYKTNSEIEVPMIAFQFKDATLEIPQLSTFVEVEDGVYCFTAAPTHLRRLLIWLILSPSLEMFGSGTFWSLMIFKKRWFHFGLQIAAKSSKITTTNMNKTSIIE